jgi:hypothetical protein
MDDREYELKQAELALKQREVAAREREVTAKERESHVTWWKNPLIVGLIGAALALGGNIVTNILSNLASDKAEHFRAQSNLVLQVIKTNGNEDDACKNLNFFVNIGWLDDPNGAIHNACGKKGKDGVPTLPATVVGALSAGAGAVTGLTSQPLGGAGLGELTVKVEDATSHKPIANARVDFEQPRLIFTQPSLNGSDVVRSAFTDANGLTTVIMSFGTSYDGITVSKDGYETTKKPLAQDLSFSITTITIDLQRAAKQARPNH